MLQLILMLRIALSGCKINVFCALSATSFSWLILYTAAMNLLNALRDHTSMPEVLQKGQPCTWRSMVIKVAATVIQSTRLVVVKLAGNGPWWHLYQRTAGRGNFSGQGLIVM